MCDCVFVPFIGICDLPQCSEPVLYGVAMIGHKIARSAHILLILLTVGSLLHLSLPNPITTPEDVDNQHKDSLLGLLVSGDEQKQDEKRESFLKEEDEDELFTDMDPRLLAAVLLESLNQSQEVRRREEEQRDGMEDDMKAERGGPRVEETDREVRMMEGANRERDGRQGLELLMAAQGKDQENEEAEERRKAQEEEERMTEKVTSHTTSQTVQIQAEQKPSSDTGAKNGQDTTTQQGPSSPEHASNEEEEQLNPEELKSLETMMKEFPRLNTATKREGDLEENDRESRGYSSYNEIIPLNKGSNLAMSKKKLKWQEETQKAMNFPTFRGNFMDEFEDNNVAAGNAVLTPVEQGLIDDDVPEEEEEEVLSPEEEEAQAKAEQEEMRRQAAEAQRAKMEEEKLADIASDMLLRYMGKQGTGNKKYSSSLSNAAEDKRSDEEQEVTEEDEIDPQTIDKLIEISSKLHLPADDVVDIISDVEKKKKKDMSPEQGSRWQRPLTPLASSFSSTNGLSAPQISTNQNRYPGSKQPSPTFNLLKTWFQEKPQTKPQDLWINLPTPLLPNQNLWPKPQKPLSIRQGLLLKTPKSGYPLYPYSYPAYYQRKPYSDYSPIYYLPPPRPKPRFYLPKSASFLGNLMGDTYSLAPSRRYHGWVQPQLRKPPNGLQQRRYYTNYPLPLYPWTFQPAPVPRSHSMWGKPVVPPPQKQFFYSFLEHPGTGNEDYYMQRKQMENSNHEDLENHIKQFLLKRPQIRD